MVKSQVKSFILTSTRRCEGRLRLPRLTSGARYYRRNVTMKIPTIKEVMHGHCDFVKFEDQKLWYSVDWAYGTFDFPIPTDDVGGGSFGLTEKAITLMRWIRKHIEYLTSCEA